LIRILQEGVGFPFASRSVSLSGQGTQYPSYYDAGQKGERYYVAKQSVAHISSRRCLVSRGSILRFESSTIISELPFRLIHQPR
jgi:hypothetical protein